MSFDINDIKRALRASIQALEENKQQLNKLDAAIGDGDHGRSIAKAFSSMEGTLETMETDDVGELLQEMGKQIVFSSGAAAGPLYGTAFMEAGKAVSGKQTIGLSDLAGMFAAAEEGVKKRGGGKVGEKTMLDTIHPAREAIQNATESDLEVSAALNKTIKAARKGRDSTEEMISQRGRSSRLGERTKGHIDPGAASSYIVIESMLKSCGGD